MHTHSSLQCPDYVFIFMRQLDSCCLKVKGGQTKFWFKVHKFLGSFRNYILKFLRFGSPLIEIRTFFS
jgi:hypothetical protein